MCALRAAERALSASPSSNKIDFLNTHGLEDVAVRRSGAHMGDDGKGSEAQEEDERGFHGGWWYLGENLFLRIQHRRGRETKQQPGKQQLS